MSTFLFIGTSARQRLTIAGQLSLQVASQHSSQHASQSADQSVDQSLRHGSVIATYSRCCYLNLPADLGLLCIGQPDILPGPINLLFDSTEHWREFRQQLQINPTVGFAAGALMVGHRAYEHTAVRISNDAIPFWCHDVTAATLHKRLHGLIAFAPAESLVSILFSTEAAQAKRQRTRLQCSFESYIVPACFILGEHLKQILQSKRPSGHSDSSASYIEHLSALVLPLLGAGQGLTPAGDDFSAGVLLALRFFGYQELCAALMDEIREPAETRTNQISATLLEQASIGLAGQLMIAVFSQLNARSAFDCGQVSLMLDQQGHTSGWDCLAGVVLLMQSLPVNITINRKLSLC